MTTSCPHWCQRRHRPEWPVHEHLVTTIHVDPPPADLDALAVDIDVHVVQYLNEDPKVEITRHTDPETAVTPLAAGVAAALSTVIGDVGGDHRARLALVQSLAKAASLLDPDRGR